MLIYLLYQQKTHLCCTYKHITSKSKTIVNVDLFYFCTFFGVVIHNQEERLFLNAQDPHSGVVCAALKSVGLNNLLVSRLWNAFHEIHLLSFYPAFFGLKTRPKEQRWNRFGLGGFVWTADEGRIWRGPGNPFRFGIL